MKRKANIRKSKKTNNLSAYATLENRNLLAGITFDSATGVVTISGSAQADFAQVNFVNNQIQVTFNGIGTQNFASSSLTKVVFSGGDGNDWFRNNTSVPTQANGHRGDDTLIGGAANDILRGGDGIDRVYGNSGNDSLAGDSGRDYFFGGIGHDSINGGIGNDRLLGEGGNDSINAGDGNDYSDGGTGNDTINAEAGDDKVFGRTGDDTISGGFGNDVLFGEDNMDRIFGDDGNDTIDCGNGGDFGRGGSGNDDLNGQSGNDDLNGDSNDDNVVGGSGSDSMSGGSGNDDFSSDSSDSVSDSPEDYSAEGDFEVRGTISNLDTVAKTFSILGFTVNYANARVEGVLANGAFFKAEGTTTSGNVIATEVEQKLPTDSIDNFEARGTVSNLNTVDQTFSFLGVTVDYSDAQINGTLSNGAAIKVEGVLDAGTVAAREIYFGFQDDININVNFELRATVSNLDTSAKTFMLLGILVDYSKAFVQGSIAEGSIVKVDGNLANGQLTAREVELEDDFNDSNVEAFGAISNVNTTAKTFSILGLTVDYSSARLDVGINDGAIVRLEGNLAAGIITAERVR